MFARQRLQKFDDERLVFGWSIPTELIPEHDFYCRFQRRGGSVMEIRSRQLDVSEARHLEYELVAFPLSHVVSSEVGGRDVAALREVVTHHAKFLEHVSADIHSLMAGHATVALESRITLQFFGADCTGIAAQITIKAGW